MIGNLMSEKTNCATPETLPIEGYVHRAPEISRSDDGRSAVVDATHIYYRELNAAVTELACAGVRAITLQGVNGQRYIANGLCEHDLRLRVEGTPGQDLGMFLGGAQLEVLGNAQDGVGNTMEDGRIVVHGCAGDVVGYGMRGGTVFVRGDVGYRVGIHMKEYQNRIPAIVIGGKARDFFGEYMAGGRIILLNLTSRLAGEAVGNYTGTGMHGGEIYVRGHLSQALCGREVGTYPATDAEIAELKPLIEEFCVLFGLNSDAVLADPFTRIAPVSSRPYGKLYASL
jgi:glutamate synthase domain-containing protein 3